MIVGTQTFLLSTELDGGRVFLELAHRCCDGEMMSILPRSPVGKKEIFENEMNV